MPNTVEFSHLPGFAVRAIIMGGDTGCEPAVPAARIRGGEGSEGSGEDMSAQGIGQSGALAEAQNPPAMRVLTGCDQPPTESSCSKKLREL